MPLFSAHIASFSQYILDFYTINSIEGKGTLIRLHLSGRYFSLCCFCSAIFQIIIDIKITISNSKPIRIDMKRPKVEITSMINEDIHAPKP